MVSRERVQSVLDRIRPLMQADGGDIELVDVSGNNARVRLTGMCSGCPSAHLTLHMGVEVALREEIQEFEELQVVGA
jgi:Fe-S cluster biogenesis protein NfuA